MKRDPEHSVACISDEFGRKLKMLNSWYTQAERGDFATNLKVRMGYQGEFAKGLSEMRPIDARLRAGQVHQPAIQAVRFVRCSREGFFQLYPLGKCCRGGMQNRLVPRL